MRRNYIRFSDLVDKFDNMSNAELMGTIEHKIGKMAITQYAYDNVLIKILSYDKQVGTMKYEELYITHDALSKLAECCEEGSNIFNCSSRDIDILESAYII